MSRPSPTIEDAIAFLKAGGVVAAASESSFGLFADATNPRALDRLFALKDRDTNKGVGLVIPSLEAWSFWVTEIPAPAHALATRYWPGPLTLVLPAAAHVDARLTVSGSIGVRQPGASPALDLVTRSGLALTATSANPPGDPPALSDAEVRRAFERHNPDELLILPGSAPGSLPSTFVRVTDAGVEVLRQGAIRL